MSVRCVFVLGIVLVAGCASSSSTSSSSSAREPREPVKKEEAIADPETVGAPAAGEGDDPRTWEDTTQGPAATLIYVTRRRDRTGVVPMMIVFTSDPKQRHFTERETSDLSVKRLKKATMGKLLEQLQVDGLEALPWLDQPRDAAIGPERALIFLQPRRSRRVEKDGLSEQERRVFSEIEKRLIAMTNAR